MRRHALVLALVSCKPTQIPEAMTPGPPAVEDRFEQSAPEAFVPAEPQGPTIAWNVSGDVCEFAVVSPNAVVSVHHSGLHRRDKGTGIQTWERPIGGWLSSDDTTVYVAKFQNLIAIDISDGSERWRYQIPTSANLQSPATVDGQVLYLADFRMLPGKKMSVGPSRLHALDAETGVERWSVELPNGVISAAPTYDEERVYVVREFGMSAISKASGTVDWSTHQATSRTTASLVGDNLIVAAHKLFGLSKTDGSESWSIPGHTLSLVQPRVHEGLVYAVIPEHRRIENSKAWYVTSVAEIDPVTGKRRWQQWFEQPIRGTISVTEDRIHAASWDGKLYELDRRSGEIRWAMDLGLGQSNPTVLTDDEAVYVCGGDRLVRIDLPTLDDAPRARFEGPAETAASARVHRRQPR